MARTPAAPPQMNISISTAIKAGFFGAIGFFVAQIVIVPVVLLLLVLFGISLAGVGMAGAKLSDPNAAPSPAPVRWSSRPAANSATR